MNASEVSPSCNKESRLNDVSGSENRAETSLSAHPRLCSDLSSARVSASAENEYTSQKGATRCPPDKKRTRSQSPRAQSARRSARFPRETREVFHRRRQLVLKLRVRVPLTRWHYLSLFSIYAVLTGPVYLNWAPLRQLLFGCAVYKWVCHAGITDSTSAYFIESDSGTCAQQRIRVANLFTLCTVADYGMSFFGGLVMDLYGPKAASLAGTLCMLLGWLLLGLSSNTFEAFEAGAVVYGLGIDMAFYGTLTVGALFPKKENTVRTLLVAMRCASYLIPLMMQRLASAFNVQYTIVMLSFGGLTYIPALLLAGIFIPSTWREHLQRCDVVERKRSASHPRNSVMGGGRGSLPCVKNPLEEVGREEEEHSYQSANDEDGKPVALDVSDTDRGQNFYMNTCGWCDTVFTETLSSLPTCSHNSPANLGRLAPQLSENAQTSSELCSGSDNASSKKANAISTPREPELGRTGDAEVRVDTVGQPAAVNTSREQGEFGKEEIEKVLPNRERTEGQWEHQNLPAAKSPSAKSSSVQSIKRFTRAYLCSGLYFPVVPYFAITLIRAVYFNTASHDLVPHALPFLHFIVGFVFIFPPLFGFLADRFGVILCMGLTNGFGLLVIIGSLLVIELGVVFVEYVVAVLFMLTMSMMTNQIFLYVGDTFPQQHLGKLIGFAFTVGGLLSLFASSLFQYSVDESKKNASTVGFRRVLLLLTAFSILTFLLLFILYKKRCRSKVLAPTER